jgi:hypothetical protein
MTFKKIVGFGDSWIWGDELLDPTLDSDTNVDCINNKSYREHNCFLGKLGHHYQVPVENYGIPGGSLQSTIWTYIWWAEHESVPLQDCLVLVSLTGAWRQSFYNPDCSTVDPDRPWDRFVHNTGNSYTAEWQTVMKQLLVMTDSTELKKLNYKQTVWFFDGQSRAHSLIQFCSITPPCVLTVPSLLWPDRSLQNFLSTDNLAPGSHPNQSGHDLIANKLISQIDSCIIKG